jgi:plasmid stabilization system protein ParE
VIFIVSKRARRHIEAAQAWWIENRPAARTALLDELSGVEARLRVSPTLGAVYSAHPSGTVRRLLLSTTQKHFYYRYVESRDELTVLAVWGARRGRGPKL